MTIVSKSELADHLRVTRAAVTNYVKRGLPVRPDGKIDLEAALNWISTNIDPHHCGKGAGAAASVHAYVRSTASWRGSGPLIPAGFAVLEKIKNPGDAMMVAGILLMISRVGSLATIAAHGAGADRKVADRTGEVFTALFAQAATEMLVECGVEPITSNPDAMKWPHPRNYDKVNWAKLGAPGEFARQAAK